MDESINTANIKQSRQKPPLSNSRIAGEIIAGLVIGISVALLVSCVMVYGVSGEFFGALTNWSRKGSEFDGLVFLAVGFLALIPFLIVYVPAAAIGVYLVSDRGEQTGSLLATVGASLLGLVFIIVLPPLVIITVPIMATIGFNLTRRYK